MFQAMYLIAAEEPPMLKDQSKWSGTFKDFIATCLKKEPADRPTASSLLKVVLCSSAIPNR